jgi:transposase
MEVFEQKKVKEKLPPGRQPKHTLEFMMMVAKQVVEKELSYREASKLYGVSHGTIGSWIKKLKKKNWGNASKNKQVSEEIHRYRIDTQVKELKHEIAELYLENLMLKKILQHSQQIKKESSSVITSETLDQLRKAARS